FSLCRHLTHLELSAARGERPRPERDDPEVDLLRRRGLDHERRFLDRLHAQGLTVAVVPPLDAADGGPGTAAGLTWDAMKAGAAVIHQATFFDGRWSGTADFLLRVDGRSSDLGPYSYEPADAKLAREARPPVLLQLCVYAELQQHRGACLARQLRVGGLVGVRAEVAGSAVHAQEEIGGARPAPIEERGLMDHGRARLHRVPGQPGGRSRPAVCGVERRYDGHREALCVQPVEEPPLVVEAAAPQQIDLGVVALRPGALTPRRRQLEVGEVAAEAE